MSAFTGEIFTLSTPYVAAAQGNAASLRIWDPTITTYYKMTGYYEAGFVFETFVVTSAPSNAPPSGHTLTNVFIAASWTI